ncbi:HAD hydrolase family protein [Lactococcus petauri]|uniref:HAD hydrolase family protein n=1 Tax=Lactococcus petauri TaxID=1940789 RepID=UPI003D6F86B9
MLTYCGREYATDNTPENVKQIADYTCPSNNEEDTCYFESLISKNLIQGSIVSLIKSCK